MAYNFFQALKVLRNSIPIFAEKCIKGIQPRTEGLNIVHRSVGLVTALNPIIGYKAASKIAKMALNTGRTVRELVLEEGLMDEKWLDLVLAPERMTRPGTAGREHKPSKTN